MKAVHIGIPWWQKKIRITRGEVFIFFAVIVMRNKLIKIQNGIRSLNPNGKIEKSHDIKLWKFLS